ncbi:hypothetical protein [Mucilaginibacter sp. HD30]
MILNNVTTSNSKTPLTVYVDEGVYNNLQINFDNAILFPGLVNSHDHLDFNLFPQFGGNVYNNYTEWGSYIHQNYKNEIAEVLKVPLELRIQWGLFKNLLCGVTTVVNHGAYLYTHNAPITVLQTCCIHSVQFDRLWKLKLNNPLKAKQQVVVHVGEGKDKLANKEIDQLISWNIWRKRVIAVHGVAMSAKQAKKVKALVWCPDSNFFLLNKTAQVNELNTYTCLLFGTDSTLTANWNIWHHLRYARKTQLLNDEELYDTFNRNAAKIWKLQNEKADIVIAKNKHTDSFYNAFYAVDPEDILLVLHQGNIRLFDEQMLSQLPGINIEKYSKIYVNGSCKYVEGNLAALITDIKRYYPRADFPITVDKVA